MFECVNSLVFILMEQNEKEQDVGISSDSIFLLLLCSVFLLFSFSVFAARSVLLLLLCGRKN